MSDNFELLWNTVRERARTLINPISYSTFIEHLVPVDVVNKKIVLKAGTEMAAAQIMKSYTKQLQDAEKSARQGGIVRRLRFAQYCQEHGRSVLAADWLRLALASLQAQQAAD